MEFYLRNKNLLAVFLFAFLAFSCENEEKKIEETAQKKVEYDMYKPSEMANFMNAMYIYNQQIRDQIIAGETPTSMPLDLMTLHSAEMSDDKGRTPVWNSFVNVFIESQKTIADTLSNVELKQRYNDAITNCLNCHKTECVGPIPKIKKLLIQ